jgi:hypothetical protein
MAAEPACQVPFRIETDARSSRCKGRKGGQIPLSDEVIPQNGVMGHIRAREPEVPPLPGLSCDYRRCFPRLPLLFAHGKRRGLRCGVPPGLPAT